MKSSCSLDETEGIVRPLASHFPRRQRKDERSYVVAAPKGLGDDACSSSADDPKQRFGFGSIYAPQDGRAISSHLMTQQSDNQLKIGL
jgi:hypothetical protein